MFGNDRESIRTAYREAWRKYRERLPLEPLEAFIADVVAAHPEYHRLLEQDGDLDRDYTPEDGEANPFLHMGMHLALREQVGTDRPTGIAQIHQTLTKRQGGAHEADHLMMECLGKALWQAHRDGGAPDEAAYLECLKAL